MKLILTIACVTILLPALSQIQFICAGQVATVNPGALGFTLSPAPVGFTLNPGNNQFTSGNLLLTPASTTSYTLTAGNGSATQAIAFTVHVNPQPLVSPTFTQFTCNTFTNAFNLNLTIIPVGAPPVYTINWATGSSGPMIPNGWVQPQTAFTGSIAPGNYTALITASGGCQTTAIVSISPAPSPATFNLSHPAQTHILTCAQPSINLLASNPLLLYSWQSNNPVVSGASVQLTYTNTGTWTVSATNTISGCVSSHMFAVQVYTTVPQASLSPASQTISCGIPSPVPVTVTAVSPMVNISHFVIFQGGSTLTNNNPSTSFLPPPGTHTYAMMNSINGCSTTSIFSVTALTGFPAYTLGFSSVTPTLGCATKSCIVASFAQYQTNPPGGGLTFTILPPGSNGITTGSLSTTQHYTICSAGTWTAIAKDNNSACESRVPFTVLSISDGPALDSLGITKSFGGGGYVDCSTPVATLQAFNFSPGLNVQYLWTLPGTPGISAGAVVNATANWVVPTQTLLGNYTLTLTNPVNLCTTTTIIPIYQNIHRPNTVISSGGIFSLTCQTPTLFLTNQSSTGIPANSPFPRNLQVIGYIWEGPPPQQPLQMSTSYGVSTPGSYTLVAKDLNNGCLGTATIIVADGRTTVPKIIPPSGPFDICHNTQVSIPSEVQPPLTGLSFSWSVPFHAIVSGIETGTLTTNSVGVYTLNVKEINGCVATMTYVVGFCVGLAGNNFTDPFEITANSVTGEVRLINSASPEIRVEIYDLSFRLILSKRIQAGDSIILPPDKGLYIVRGTDSRSVITKKVFRE